MFKTGAIEGIVVKNLVKYVDDRGWLVEIFRQDEMEEKYFPVMGYISMTAAGIVRGPHEHLDQADCFVFIGPSNFKVILWDNRKTSPTYMVRQVLYAGEDAPKSILVPPGVVHAYKNVGDKQGMVVNVPNRLFAGRGRKEPVDEIRHELDANSIFIVD
jgi:dTDP-4-dehydrorhamnose 3,5-epimerase